MGALRCGRTGRPTAGGWSFLDAPIGDVLGARPGDGGQPEPRRRRTSPSACRGAHFTSPTATSCCAHRRGPAPPIRFGGALCCPLGRSAAPARRWRLGEAVLGGRRRLEGGAGSTRIAWNQSSIDFSDGIPDVFVEALLGRSVVLLGA